MKEIDFENMGSNWWKMEGGDHRNRREAAAIIERQKPKSSLKSNALDFYTT